MTKQIVSPGTLYLIPVPLIPGALQTLSPQVIAVIHHTRYFIVENARTARRFIKSSNPSQAIEDLHIIEFEKHTQGDPVILLYPVFEGHDVGIMSEAGCPGIADPGSQIVLNAHERGVRVVPLTGPSSILLTLMASGMNGQHFQFHGYLSPKKDHIASDIRRLEEISRRDRATQIFIETPYRNLQILEAALKVLAPSTLLCVGVDLTSESEMVCTRAISKWKETPFPDLHKRPAVFCIEAK